MTPVQDVELTQSTSRDYRGSGAGSVDGTSSKRTKTFKNTALLNGIL